jgi:hypothetical protein
MQRATCKLSLRITVLSVVAIGAFYALAAHCDETDHWSFRPLVDTAIPETRYDELAETPIDRFLFARLEQAGIEPAPPADKRTLLRRVTYDLIGLPPTTAEIDAFLTDDSPLAYERVVERLLASPRYGERWGRHWLDLARYADTKGYIYEGRESRRFFHSHVYRDWVIGALNQDLPYDQFLVQQIAGDSLATAEDRRPLAAMGFLTLGRRFAGNFYEIIDDRIDTVSRTTMGLTVSCARCHDHKFDPITSGDYYSFYSIFAGSYDKAAPLDRELPAEQAAFAEELRKRQAAYDEYIAGRTNDVLARVRARTADYLKATLDVESLPTEHEYRFLDADDINPVFVRQWHARLIRQNAEFDPLFEPFKATAYLGESQFADGFASWFSANESKLNRTIAVALTEGMPKSKVELAERIGRAFEKVNEAALATTKPLEPLPDESDEAIRQALYGPASPIHIPEGHSDELEWFFDEPTRVEMGKLQQQIEEWLVEAPAGAEYVVYLADRAKQPEPRIFENGNPAVKGEAVPRAFVQALSHCEEESFSQGSGRLALAKAIVHPKNPLTARVLVNRVWQHHFGAAFVSPPSDFGLRSEPPTHPELLDWLALRLIESGWSVKSLHRMIVLSYAYRQSSEASDAALASDPDNRLLSRMNRRRLDYEALHDSLVAVTGWIDPVVGGRSALDGSRNRRAVYAHVDRLNVPAVMKTFDVASPDAHSPERHETTIPQQALYLMNSPLLVERVRGLMARPEVAQATAAIERIEALYKIVFARQPTEKELAVGAALASAELAEPVRPPPDDWAYGMAGYDASQGKVTSFASLAEFADGAWRRQGDTARLDASGGAAAADNQLGVARRWIAPMSGAVRISGAIEHTSGEGDGVRALIVSSRVGELAAFNIKQSSADATLTNVQVQAGDVLDFVVLCRGDAAGDEFRWSPLVRREGEEVAGERNQWSAAADFRGPPPAPLTPWEKYAQVLLLTNEFAFVD